MPLFLFRSALLIFAAVIAYFPALNTPFIFDDITTIVYNPCLQSLHPFHRIFERTTDLDITSWGRPLVALSLALNYALGKTHVLGYHLFNLFLHLLNGFLFWRLAQHLLQRQKWSLSCAAASESLGFVISLLWLVHPLGTSVTTYTVQRAESLMVFFYLGALYSGSKFWSNPSCWFWAGWTVLACWGGVLCKESIVTAPLAVLWLGWTFDRDRFYPTLRRFWFWPMAWASSWLLLAWVMTSWPRHASVGSGLLGMSGGEYLLIQTRVLLHYFALVFWPLNLSLSCPERFWPTMQDVPPDTWPLIHSPLEVWPEALLLGALLLLTVWLIIKHPGLGFILGMVFLILSPTSSLIPITTSLAADHRMYLPSAAVLSLLVLAFYLFTAQAPPSERKAVTGLRFTLTILLTVFFLTLTLLRNHDYRDGTIIWQKNILLYPRDALAWNELGSIYWMHGQMESAEQAFARGSQICDHYLLPLSNLAVCQWNLGQRSQALQNLHFILSKDPNDLSSLRNLAIFTEQAHDPGQARSFNERILHLVPQDQTARQALERLKEP